MSGQEHETQAREAFRGHLVATGRSEDDAAEIAANIDIGAFAVDGKVDQDRLHAFADKHSISARRRRNFAGGGRGDLDHPAPTASGAQAEADRRFGKRDETGQRSRNYGAGARPEPSSNVGAGGRAEAQRRYGKRP